jgi:hypothetical protein
MHSNDIIRTLADDQPATNAEAVQWFLDGGSRIKAGQSFTLPDIGQRYVVRRVKPRPKPGGGWWLFLTLVAPCAVCEVNFAQEKEASQWRRSLYVTRCCPAHRGSWKSEMVHAWKTRLELLKHPLAPVKVEPTGPRLGAVEAIVQRVVEDLRLVWDEPDEALIVAQSVERMPTGGGRDTRRQRVIRALASLRKAGLV